MKRGLVILVLLLSASFSMAVNFPRTMFVENNLGRTLSKLNLETGAIENDVLELGQVPNQILAYRDQLYVLNSVPPELMVIDPVTVQVTKKIALPEGSNPYAMALAGKNKMYVSLLMGDAVAVVDLESQQVVKQIPVGSAPEGILIDNNTALVANTGGYPEYVSSSVSVIDVTTDSVTLNIPVPTNPQVIQWGPDYNYYILCSGKWGEGAGKLVVLNMFAPPSYTPALVDTIAIGGYPGDLAILANGQAYMADWGDENNGFLYKADIYAKNVLAGPGNPVRVGKGAMRLFLDKPTGDVYVSNFADDTVQRLDTSADTVTATFPFGDGAQAMAIVEPIGESDPWADEVVAFHPGSSWSQFGYSFFPENVLGPPDPNSAINEYFGAQSEEEVLSLGSGGEITLKFSDNVIVDGPGVDFLVFENVFINAWTNQPFMEAGIVSVSQDGEHFVQFPYDTTSHAGLAGVTPVKSTQHPTNPDSSGADGFDLADLGLQWIRYVRITDMGDLWQEGPYNGDFDLDAIVAVNSAAEEPTLVADKEEDVPEDFTLLQNYPNPFNPETKIAFNLAKSSSVELAVYSISGQLVKRLVSQSLPGGRYAFVWDGKNEFGRNAASGIYLARLKAGNVQKSIKMSLVR